MKKLFRIVVLSAIASLALAATTGYSQVSNAAPATSATPKIKGSANAFRGAKVESVDATAKTITIKNKSLGERVLMQDANTVLMLDGKPATLADIKAGYFASGSLHVDGTNEYIVKGSFYKERPTPVRPPMANSTNAPASKPPMP